MAQDQGSAHSTEGTAAAARTRQDRLLRACWV